MCVFSCARDKSIKLWYQSKLLHTFNGHDNWVRSLILHPSGKYLLSAADDKMVKVWDLALGRCVKTLKAHDHFVTAVHLLDGKILRLATGSVDHSVKLWSL